MSRGKRKRQGKRVHKNRYEGQGGKSSAGSKGATQPQESVSRPPVSFSPPSLPPRPRPEPPPRLPTSVPQTPSYGREDRPTPAPAAAKPVAPKPLAEPAGHKPMPSGAGPMTPHVEDELW